MGRMRLVFAAADNGAPITFFDLNVFEASRRESFAQLCRRVEAVRVRYRDDGVHPFDERDERFEGARPIRGVKKRGDEQSTARRHTSINFSQAFGQIRPAVDGGTAVDGVQALRTEW